MWQFYRHVILLVFKMSDGCLTPAAFTRCCVRMWRLGLLHLSVSIALCLPSHTSLSLSIYPFSHSLLSICLASFLVSVSLSHFLTVLLVCSVSLSLHQEFPYKWHSIFALQQIAASTEPRWVAWWNVLEKFLYNKTTGMRVSPLSYHRRHWRPHKKHN